ncbi:AraC family transcriptional regulator [Alcanivorax sp. DG881]|jgi:AraC-like DNA-binding protein|uniref:helix-turn-helix domain-containing protein n=1 Tax=Alcanivorax sp. DG881 TaxID=236097 RepID=UPI00017ECC22|nr:AraC family transcriptional regulator [Alcanivorax sp. DG881]EDX89115.1 transcriptional regulator, AraC family protein [Alcanivorax sp. DG881]
MAAAMRVTGAWVQLLTDWLDRENLPAPALRTVLDSRSPADVVPLPLWRDLLQQAVLLRPERLAPGLEIGAMIQPRHVGMLGYLILTCRTLGEAMLAYQRYETLFYGQDMVEVVGQDDQMLVRWPGADSTGELADSVAIAALVSFLRRQVDTPPVPTRVAFAFPAPGPSIRAAFEAFFGCPVQFAQAHTCVAFPVHFLAIALPHSDPSMRSLLDRQAQAMLLALPDSDSFDRALQQAMVRLMPEAAVTLPRLAAELHMSVRTLQRRLTERQLTWRELLDRTREQLARHYLADLSLTLGDIALLLGFSEHSAFSRAYRRWTGNTPARARKQTAMAYKTENAV